jgi:hypothetical protein
LAMIITLWLEGRRYRRELEVLENRGTERSSGSA